jgi:RNA polymerase sigma-70 factor (ECF subfamily)
MLAGDQRAFDEFFAAYFPGLFRFALTRTGDDAEAAEEVVQAALCQAVARLETYRGEAPLFSWLCTFCRHELSHYFARAKRQPTAMALADEVPEIQAALDSLAAVAQQTPEQVLGRKELAGLVRLALDRLPPHYGDALEWKYIDDLPVAEIAERLKVGPKAAESVLTRAREAFRDAFAAVCGGRSLMELETRTD